MFLVVDGDGVGFLMFLNFGDCQGSEARAGDHEAAGMQRSSEGHVAVIRKVYGVGR